MGEAALQSLSAGEKQWKLRVIQDLMWNDLFHVQNLPLQHQKLDILSGTSNGNKNNCKISTLKGMTY